MSRHVFVHVGDTHLQHGHARNADRIAALDQIVAAGLATPNLAAWLWPGDLFHQKSTPDDRIAIATTLQRMAAVAPVVVCPGNHDQPGDVEIFSRLSAPWPIYVVTTPQVLHFPTATRAMASCFVLPYPHKAGLVSAGVEHDQLGQAAADALESIFIAAAAELHAAEEVIPLMIAHVNVGGSIASIGQPQIGKEIELHPTHLARLGPTVAKALNHIHRHQDIHGAVYAGSNSRNDFGEKEAKGYVEWTFDDSLVLLEPSDSAWSWRFVEIATPAQHHVEGRLTRDGFTFETLNGAELYLGPRPEYWAGADVRCRYRYVKAEVGAIDVAHILAEFAGCRSLKLDPIPELEHQVRAPEIAAAATLEDKVQRYAAMHGIPWTPAMDAKLAALQAQEQEALVAAVTQTLALMATPADVIDRDLAVAS